MSRFLGDVGIGPNLAVGDPLHGIEDIQEEIRSIDIQREFELPPPSRQVLVDLSGGLR